MGNRAVVQPNGLYARFSDIVDHFTHCNCSREELIEIYREDLGRRDAIGKLDRADAAPERFEDEINTIGFVHGPLEAERTKVLLSSDPMSRCPIPPGLRCENDPWDLHQEIADYERHLAILEAFPGDDEDDVEVRMRERYRKELAMLKAFEAEKDIHMDTVHDRLLNEWKKQNEN